MKKIFNSWVISGDPVVKEGQRPICENSLLFNCDEGPQSYSILLGTEIWRIDDYLERDPSRKPDAL